MPCCCVNGQVIYGSRASVSESTNKQAVSTVVRWLELIPEDGRITGKAREEILTKVVSYVMPPLRKKGQEVGWEVL